MYSSTSARASRFAAGCLLILLTFAAAAESQQTTGTSVKFLAISDIHFNPYFGLDQTEFAQLAAMPVSDWSDFFAARAFPFSSDQWPTQADSNYRLMTSAFAAAARQIKDPGFVLYPGDFLCHEWKQNYTLATRKSADDLSIKDDPEAFREFTSKSLEFVTLELEKHFPNSKIFATPGNDDSFCEDYWFQRSGAFSAMLARVWKPLVGDAVVEAEFTASVRDIGSYSADLPGLPNHRLISLNTVFLSKVYCSDNHPVARWGDCCGCIDQQAGPGDALLKWFNSELQRTKADKKHVWLLMHVPPGMDSYAESHPQGGVTAAAGHQWRNDVAPGDFLDRFLRLIARDPQRVQVSFAGHTHMDDFRIDLSPTKRPMLLHKIVPSVSPVNGNNPAFQIFTCDSVSGELTNYETHFLPLKPASPPPADGSDRPVPQWHAEYNAAKTYGLSTINAESVTRLFREIKADPKGAKASSYARYYKVSAAEIQPVHLMVYICAILNARYSDYAACYHASTQRVPPEFLEDSDLLRRRAAGLAQ